MKAPKKMPDTSTMNERQLAEWQLIHLERIRKNTGATADILGIFLFFAIIGVLISVLS